MRVGILGGSFDPIHLGHAAVARAAIERAGLDAVEVVVAAVPPHKRRGCRAPFAHRLAMARLAVEGLRKVGVRDLEGCREGPSYTFYTVTELSRERPGAAFALLVGADMLEDLPRWHRAAELLSSAQVIAFARPGNRLETAQKRFLEAFPGLQPEILEVEPVPASSSEIRRRIAAGEPLAGLLDPRVEAYIRQNGLYLRG